MSNYNDVYLFSELTNVSRMVCYNSEFLKNFCSLYPLQTMKTVRLSLDLVEEFLNDPLVVSYVCINDMLIMIHIIVSNI